MRVLAIETSCDDTGAAVILNGRKILSNIVSSQVPIHQKYGGVVPELASRKHIESIVPIVAEALKTAKVTLKEVDGIAVTQGPGLVGSLLVGLSFGRANGPDHRLRRTRKHIGASGDVGLGGCSHERHVRERAGPGLVDLDARVDGGDTLGKAVDIGLGVAHFHWARDADDLGCG